MSDAQHTAQLIAAFTRHRGADAPVLIPLREKLAQDKLVAAVERALAKAPPLKSETRERIIGLLSTAA